MFCIITYVCVLSELNIQCIVLMIVSDDASTIHNDGLLMFECVMILAGSGKNCEHTEQ